LEVEENLRRKDLTFVEYQKKTVALAGQVRQRLAQQAPEAAPTAEQGFSATVAKKPQGGRPKGSKMKDSQQAVADAMGIPQRTLSDAEAYVAALERYPELQRPGVPMKDVLTMAKTLDAMDLDVRAQKREAVRNDQPNILAELVGNPPMRFEDHQVKFVIDQRTGEEWLNAGDCCEVLGLENVTWAINRLKDKHKAQFSFTNVRGETRPTWFINEPGFYRLTEEEVLATGAKTPYLNNLRFTAPPHVHLC
jgi:hypothetical protein